MKVHFCLKLDFKSMYVAFEIYVELESHFMAQ